MLGPIGLSKAPPGLDTSRNPTRRSSGEKPGGGMPTNAMAHDEGGLSICHVGASGDGVAEEDRRRAAQAAGPDARFGVVLEWFVNKSHPDLT